jgi:hypothetical protein
MTWIVCDTEEYYQTITAFDNYDDAKKFFDSYDAGIADVYIAEVKAMKRYDFKESEDK